MIVIARAVLTTAELAQLSEFLADARFSDGSLSAIGRARSVKHVAQLDREGDIQREPGELIARALLRHPTVQAAVFPKSVRHPTVNRYDPGMEYGPHLDLPIMGTPKTRADVSATLFLNDPESYQGGELSIDCDSMPIDFKGAAGDALLYPSDSIHRVKPVQQGSRWVAVTWFQSFFRESAQRKILYDLGQSLSAFESARADSEAVLKLRAAYQNLQRRWVEL